MCGIVGAIANRDVAEILLEGLKRLEYRGYDSAGLAIISPQGELQRVRRVGKVNKLKEALDSKPLKGSIGIAHTRWATHGEPTELNAHPHISDYIAVVHNGIIENYEPLREKLIAKGYQFRSETDTEVIAHLIHDIVSTDNCSLFDAVKKAIPLLRGAYGTVIMDIRNPDQLVAARSGSPLVIGCGIAEHFIASDQLALLPVTNQFIYLEEGDIALITHKTVSIFDKNNKQVKRPFVTSDVKYDAGSKTGYNHYMQKEIYEQPNAIKNTLEGRIQHGKVNLSELGEQSNTILKQVEHISKLLLAVPRIMLVWLLAIGLKH